jgi:stress response protein YsnF
MSRTVAALYDSRAEAELARNRLVSGVKAKSPRIIAKDTLGAVDGLSIDPKAKAKYREAVRDGSNLLVADLPSGTKSTQVVDLLDVSVSDSKAEWPPAQQLPNQPVADGESAFHVADEAADPSPPPPPARAARPKAVMPPVAPAEPIRPAMTETKAPDLNKANDLPRADELVTTDDPLRTERRQPEPPARKPAEQRQPVVEEVRIPKIEEELRVGKREVSRGGARVHSFTRETPAEAQVALQEEVVDVESRPSERRLSDEDVQAGGLFKERVVDIAEMREVPVVTKTAVVREEVIIRKRVVERVETVRDTVRRTQIEVEDLPATEPENTAPRFFTRDMR